MIDRVDPNELAGLLASARVLCVGDVMLDRFVEGHVTRISPEAPIPVLRAVGEVTHPGGAGNVAANLSSLGCVCRLIAPMGRDAAAAEITRLCAGLPGLSADWVEIPHRPSIVKTRYVAHGQQLLRVDQEESTPLPEEWEARIIAAATAHIREYAVLVLSDYGKGALSPRVVATLIAAARQAGVPVIVDPKGRDFGKYRGATLLTPNRQELALAAGMPAATDAQVEAACLSVMRDCGVEGVLATRSEQGITLVLGGAADDAPGVTHLTARAREVFDVAGAGDTVVAVTAAGLAAGISTAMTARLANIAGGVVVGKAGTAAVGVEDIRLALLETPGHRDQAGAVPWETALERVRGWRRRGLRVGFANGCFDLLHPGHLSLIAQARRACDRLILAVNSDASVRRLKGPSRPVQDQQARAALLSALADVDLTVIFEEDTPLRLIEFLQPDLLVKGADYSEDQVVGAEIVKRRGGRVLLCNLLDGHSTTAALRRLRGE